MKMFRHALVGTLPAFVLLVGIQPLGQAASTSPSPDMHSWFKDADTVKDRIWQSIGLLSGVAAVPESRQLGFEDRVAYQRAIEEVYWRHRIWPRESPDPKPSLDAVMSQAQLEKKVTDYLRNSQALEKHWQQPITAEQLQAEMD